MKKEYFKIFIFLLIGSLLLPLFALGEEKSGESTGQSGQAPVTQSDDFDIYITETGQIETLSREEYLLGVLAAEISPNYYTEAMKAQAVASYTFALYRKAEHEKDTYDITDSSKTDQAFYTRDQLQQMWGTEYETNVAILEEAIAAVTGQILTYDGAPILAAYHSISSGKTESAENYWGGGNYPYLTVVESVGDILSPQYLSTVTFTEEEFSAVLQKQLQITTSGDAADWVGESDCTPSGTVQTQIICGKEITGGELRSACSLASQNFDLTYQDGKFTFTVRGSGHDVGMSQYGANYMASLGSDYREILSWYYPGTTLVEE